MHDYPTFACGDDARCHEPDHLICDGREAPPCTCEAAAGRYSTHLPFCPAVHHPVVWA